MTNLYPKITITRINEKTRINDSCFFSLILVSFRWFSLLFAHVDVDGGA